MTSPHPLPCSIEPIHFDERSLTLMRDLSDLSAGTARSRLVTGINLENVGLSLSLSDSLRVILNIGHCPRLYAAPQ